MRATLKALIRTLVLAISVSAGVALAQSPAASARNSGERERLLVAEIQQEQSANGAFSAALLARWMALALLYEEDESPALANGALEQARQVVRANYGFQSMKEAALIRQEMHNDKVLGNAEAAWDHEQKLLALVALNPDDLETVPMLSEIADERLDILKRYQAGHLPPQIVLGCYYKKWAERPVPIAVDQQEVGSGCAAGDRDKVIRSLFAEAKYYYRNAIDVLIGSRRYSSPELRELEANLTSASYWSADYVAGKRSYSRLVSYNAAGSAPLLARIKTFAEMTDWDLLFSQEAGTAILDGIVQAYQQAYDLLEREHIPQTSIDEIFAPKIPVALPAFLPNPLVSEEQSDSVGYIDVAFDITQYGRSRHVKIMGATENATAAAKRDLVRLIGRSLFRPRVVDGKLGQTSRVMVRYYPKS